ncbi:MAG: DUF262 domain-containing protein [Planctomycetaceae bacterium]|nr:DUF262 domain-containing protein [Planctomycetaceae bacterium]
MAEPLTIRKIIDRISSGDIRIPAFQRGYVWLPDQVAFLIDSIYKGFPIGTIFLWCTDNRLKSEKSLGHFVLPEPKKDYPVNYVLDGQQRLTSLFSVFQTELKPSIDNTENEWIDIYFDVDVDENLQDSLFFALRDSEVDVKRHFPMKTMFDSAEYRRATSNFVGEKIAKIDKVQEKFKEALIQVQSLETDDRNKVAIVFERINRAGTELDIYQLLTAWSWSEDFDLQEKFNILVEQISPFGFGDFSNDQDLQLKCCSGVIVNEASPSAILRMQGEDVRNKFLEVENGIKSSIDFLKKEVKVSSLACMPFASMMVGLTTFFASNKIAGMTMTDSQRREILRWFWRSIFSQRYSAGVNKRHETDIAEFQKLKANPDYKLKEFNVNIDESFFLNSRFNVSSVNTKSFILLLSQFSPKSFISGANVDLEEVLKKANRNEFHHIFPNKYLKRLGTPQNKINCLANFCFLSNADNQKIKDKAPNEYKTLIPNTTLKDIMIHALCPENSLDLNFDQFLTDRAKLLLGKVRELIK